MFVREDASCHAKETKDVVVAEKKTTIICDGAVPLLRTGKIVRSSHERHIPAIRSEFAMT